MAWRSGARIGQSNSTPGLGLKPEELRWASSSMYNQGVELHGCGLHAAAAGPLHVAYQAAVAVTLHLKQDGDAQVIFTSS